MIAVAIVGILAAIAIPSYLAYTQQANRTDATHALTVISQALERCYSQSFTYAGCAAAPVGSTASSQGYYTVALTVSTTPTMTYSLSATPLKSPQLTDEQCTSFTLDNTGKQQAFNSGGVDNTKVCWGST
jgi:type IV pilus assembly protein PilE